MAGTASSEFTKRSEHQVETAEPRPGQVRAPECPSEPNNTSEEDSGNLSKQDRK